MICYLYQGAGVFDKQTPDAGNAGGSFPASSSSNTHGDPPLSTLDPSESNRAKERRDHMRSRAGLPQADGEELSHGTVETSLNPWDEGEHEAAAGFGSFGSAYGGDGKYDGAGLDRLMRLMAAARTLKLPRLQVCMYLLRVGVEQLR